VGFVVDKVALGQVFSDYFGFLCQFSFHRLFHTHHHLSSGAGTIGQLVADVPSGLSLTPSHETKKMQLEEIFCNGVDWISVAQDRLERFGFFKLVMKIQVL
jgi:hypothetical protein